MNWLKWEKTRASEYYDKIRLFKIFNFMDCYIIKMSKAVAISYHTDPIPNKKHYRLNIFFIKRQCEFWIDFKQNYKRIVWFRPDIQQHSLEVIGNDAKALILSIGFAI